MSRGVFGWSYPPGVTGNEPEITGECPDCGSADCDGDCYCANCGREREVCVNLGDCPGDHEI